MTRSWVRPLAALLFLATPGLVVAQNALTPKARRTHPGDPGTIESAITTYNGNVRLVDEGTLPASQATGGCPADMGKVDDRFCVDKWEGSIVEVLDPMLTGDSLLPSPSASAPLLVTPGSGTRSTITLGPSASPKFAPHPANLPLDDGKVYQARSVAGVVPQAYISAEQAQLACSAVGKRLCNPTEWRLACGGSNAWVYPYGTTHLASRCNDAGKNPMLLYHPPPTNKRGWPGWNLEELNDPRNNLLEGSIAKTGAFAGCVNDWGAYDMVGNLHEWTSDPNGTFQGGYYLDTTINGEGCAYRTTAHHYRYHDYSTGFRCCSALK